LPRFERSWPCELVVLSAESRGALAERCQRLADWLERGAVALVDVAATCAQVGGPERLAIVAADVPELVRKLRHAGRLLAEPARTKIQDRSGVFWFSQPLAKTGRLAFVFPGEGAQYPGMLSELGRHFPVVLRQFDLSDAGFLRYGQAGLLSQVVFPQRGSGGAAEQQLLSLEGAVGAVTAANRALLALLTQLEVRADAVVGHSSGEFAALSAAGSHRPADDEAMVQAIADGAAAAARINRAGLAPDAVLTAVGGVAPAAVQRALAELAGRVTIAMDNCPNQLVVSGGEEASERFVKSLAGQGGMCERLMWGRAYHTPAFAPACQPLDDYYRSLDLRSPSIELWSCATADRFPQDPLQVRELAVRQWRSPVRFRETIDKMHAAGVRVFVEVGPRGGLTGFVSDTLSDRPHLAVAIDSSRRGGLQQLCHAIGLLAAHGVNLNLDTLYAVRSPRMLDFTQASPAEPPQFPLLPFELPRFSVSNEMATEWRAGLAKPSQEPARPVVAAPAARANGHRDPLPVPAPRSPALASRAAAAFAPASPAASRIEGSRPTPLALSAQIPAPSPHRVVESSPRRVALDDFQRTMQDFLSLQQRVITTAMRGACGAGSVPARTAAAAVAPPVGRRPASVAMASPPALAPPARPQPPAPAHPLASPVAVAPTAPPLGLAAPTAFDLITLIHEPPHRVLVECEIDPDVHRFLIDHTFFGRDISTSDPTLRPLSVMPLAMSLELMAEAASLLRPGMRVVALRDVQTMRWLTFEGATRRLRIEAVAQEGDDLQVTVYEADSEGMSAAVATGCLEFRSESAELGPASLPDRARQTGIWSDEQIYGCGLFHGPAFRAVTSVDRSDDAGVCALVVEPEEALMFSGKRARLLLPVALIDTLGQLAGMPITKLPTPGQTEIELTFPNRIARLEFVDDRPPNTPLRAVAPMDREGNHVRYHAELIAPDGRVVLRAVDRVDEIVQLAGGLYLHWSHPRRLTLCRELTDLFSDLPGIDQVRVCRTSGAGDRVLVKRLWHQALARMVLSRAERRWLDSQKLPPVPAATWLLGRVAAKDAVRLLTGFERLLPDIPVLRAASGQPLVAWEHGPAVGVSLAHKGFAAVAAACWGERSAGVGIDLEPAGQEPLAAEVRADAFSEREKGLIAAAVERSSRASDAWHRAVWTAKEAFGKALGTGLAHPLEAEVTALDPRTGRMTVCPRGAVAEGVGRAWTAGVETACRELDGLLITLCILPPRESDRTT
jgi:malonyl CoA-acyl carrier protein transacylase/4'-phosphopantetheinyl transferase EntD